MGLKAMQLTIEDERKFLVKRMPRSYLEKDSREITQWYICLDPPTRVRVENFEDCYLTIKIEKEAGKDSELEGGIPKNALPALAAVRKGNKIRKTRYFIGNLELDVFLAQLDGLVLLEFERKSREDILVMPLGFIVEEVTGDERFRSHNFAKLDSIPEKWKCKIV